MFGKKRVADSLSSETPVYTIPTEFYGGMSPEVKFKKVEKEVAVDSSDHVLSKAEKAMFHSANAAGSGQRWHPANFFSNQKSLLVSIGVIFLLFIFSAGIYYFVQWRTIQSEKAPMAPAVSYQPTNELGTSTIAPAEEPVVATTTEEVVPTLPSEAQLDFPSMLLGDSEDLDKDGISDVAEEIFQTDPAVADTDNDNYSDFTEAYNLYNPAGFAPVKIIDSGLVREFDNPVFGYQIYYPNNWALGVVDSQGRDVLFSTITGENIEVRVFDLKTGETFSDWFTMFAPREKFSDLLPFESAFKEKGLKRSDNLVYYFADAGHVYVILYHTSDSVVVNYRAAIILAARSFRLAGNSVSLTLPTTDETEVLMDSTVSTANTSMEIGASSTTL